MRVSKFRLLLPAATCAIALAVGGGVASAATPAATVTPNKNLTNAQSVSVHWSHFNAKKDKYIAIVQCTKAILTDGNQAHCDVGNAVLVSPGTASGTKPYTVHTGTIGTLAETCGTSETDEDNCLIAVAGLNKNVMAVTGQAATVAIDFKS